MAQQSMMAATLVCFEKTETRQAETPAGRVTGMTTSLDPGARPQLDTKALAVTAGQFLQTSFASIMQHSALVSSRLSESCRDLQYVCCVIAEHMLLWVLATTLAVHARCSKLSIVGETTGPMRGNCMFCILCVSRWHGLSKPCSAPSGPDQSSRSPSNVHTSISRSMLQT
jgi:hypothetical protein